MFKFSRLLSSSSIITTQQIQYNRSTKKHKKNTFPLPTVPTTATSSPCFTLKLISFSVSTVASLLHLKVACSNSSAFPVIYLHYKKKKIRKERKENKRKKKERKKERKNEYHQVGGLYQLHWDPYPLPLKTVEFCQSRAWPPRQLRGPSKLTREEFAACRSQLKQINITTTNLLTYTYTVNTIVPSSL
jgi:hypothetical protein